MIDPYDDDQRPLASSPCMAEEFAAEDTIRLFYLHIEERAGGFSWQVRRHDLEEPVEIGRQAFRSESEARTAGQAALDRACLHFRRFGFPR